MKKIFTLSFGLIMCATGARAVDWWLMPTVCRINSTYCYNSMTGAGYDPEIWDAKANCRGMKYICPEALTTKERAPVLMGRQEIASGIGFNPDFDPALLNKADSCFGMRRTSADGTKVSVNGVMTNVYCAGVLDDPDEIVQNGEIEYDIGRPTCNELAANGYAAVLNGRCYGKYYDQSKYYIECGTGLVPSRLIVLNGADIYDNNGGVDKATADSLFNKMYSISQAQKQKYFSQE